MREISAEQFVRKLKELFSHPDRRFSFFLGSGCSVSSGIGSAPTLVKRWLPRLKKEKTGDDSGYEEWAQNTYPNYDKNNLALLFKTVMEELFPSAEERQEEIETICERKAPGFGYGVLAQLMAHKDYGKHCNVVLTTNFDDMVADALYLYTYEKPLVIVHESLVGFVKIGRTRPMVVKLHGDARIFPRNTDDETDKLEVKVKSRIQTLLTETSLIFIGYGGNDQSILDILKELPANTPPWGIYWVGKEIPKNELGILLESKRAILVKHFDFDELMVIIKKEFELSHPEKKRFENIFQNYFDTYEKLDKLIEKRPESREKEILKIASERALDDLDKPWADLFEAIKIKNADPVKADKLYNKVLREMPNNAYAFNSYAYFLSDIRNDYDNAEKYFNKAIEIEPKDANTLGHYAHFLYKKRKAYDKAETFYKKSLEVDPENANTLGDYAIFLENIRKAYSQAENYYKKSLDIDPAHYINLNNYAIFLKNIRKHYNKAVKYYKKSLEINPEYANSLGNYGGFLLSQGRFEEGFEKVDKALKLADRNDVILECWFYLYAHTRDHIKRNESLHKVNELIKSGERSPGWNLDDNVNRAIADGHPEQEFLKTLAKAIADEADAKELDKFEVWKNIK